MSFTMFLKSLLLLAAMSVFLPLSSGNTCSSQFPRSVSGDRCLLKCGSQKCLCSDEASSSSASFNDCTQWCDRSPTGNNATVTSCPDMTCTNLDNCNQYCKTDSCSMECKAKKMCIQECGDGCIKAVCSADKCMQDCFNCTMECTSETRFCRHYCTGGVCHSKCAAKECVRECMSGVADCKIISVSSSSKHTLAASLYLVLVVVYILAEL